MQKIKLKKQFRSDQLTASFAKCVYYIGKYSLSYTSGNGIEKNGVRQDLEP